MLTTNPRTKLVILSDDREIAITEKQYEAIKADQSIGKYNDPVLIRDPDSKEVLFDGKIGAIKEFREINKNSVALRYVCDFGISHSIHESCECHTKYKVFPIEFRMKMHELYPNLYAKDITGEQRNKIISEIPRMKRP